jgi:hypothetical protein
MRLRLFTPHHNTALLTILVVNLLVSHMRAPTQHRAHVPYLGPSRAERAAESLKPTILPVLVRHVSRKSHRQQQPSRRVKMRKHGHCQCQTMVWRDGRLCTHRCKDRNLTRGAAGSPAPSPTCAMRLHLQHKRTTGALLHISLSDVTTKTFTVINTDGKLCQLEYVLSGRRKPMKDMPIARLIVTLKSLLESNFLIA